MNETVKNKLIPIWCIIVMTLALAYNVYGALLKNVGLMNIIILMVGPIGIITWVINFKRGIKK